MRYYYKKGKSYCCVDYELNNEEWQQITEEEFKKANAPSSKMVARQRIKELKHKLKELDYIGVKIATGRATREEYAEEIILMQRYANEINLLEEELKALEK